MSLPNGWTQPSKWCIQNGGYSISKSYQGEEKKYILWKKGQPPQILEVSEKICDCFEAHKDAIKARTDQEIPAAQGAD